MIARHLTDIADAHDAGDESANVARHALALVSKLIEAGALLPGPAWRQSTIDQATEQILDSYIDRTAHYYSGTARWH